MTAGGSSEELVAAVRAGDPDVVRELLEQGADPDTDGADGLPVLCAAVAAYDAPVAEALVEGGADPDRELPDGTTPLWRAVDSGSPAVVTAVLGEEPDLRLPEAARTRLLDLARSWCETGVVEELRRRTGASGPAAVVRVLDDGYWNVDQVSLGGRTVRDGHAAVLTWLEWSFGVMTPVGELVGRALAHRDEDHVTWSEVSLVLPWRCRTETWSALMPYHRHPDPDYRLFLAHCLWGRDTFGREDPYTDKEIELLTAWALEEPDARVLAKLLDAFPMSGGSFGTHLGLRHAGHPDARVRREVPYVLAEFGVPLTPEQSGALAALTRDPDPEVRLAACEVGVRRKELTSDTVRALLPLVEGVHDRQVRIRAAGLLASSQGRTPEVADTLAALSADAEPLVLLEAAYGLAVREDPRTGEAIERLDPLRDELRDVLGMAYADDHRIFALWRWEAGTSGRA